jgi:queuine/archaeosine tRNA-ribosyltransferase
MRLAALYSFRYYRDLMEGILSVLAEGRFAAFKRETLAPMAEGV